jgi:hypothetical protein
MLQQMCDAIAQDLREASAWLLQAGGAGTSAPGRRDARGPLLSKIHVFASLVPGCVREIDELGPRRSTTWVRSRTPQGARASRAPRDYFCLGSQWLPLRWERQVPVRDVDTQALAWILHLWDQLWLELERTRERIGSQLERLLESMPAAEKGGDFDTEIRSRLQQMQDEFEDAEHILMRARSLATRSSISRITASPRMPLPFPGGLNWQRLGQLSARILDPEAELPDTLRGLIDGRTELADVPFLYQRWCGLQAVEALERLGWKARRDPVPQIFLGGRIDFVPPAPLPADENPLRLWVEPRIPPSSLEDEAHESGLIARGVLAMRPDYLFIVQSADGPEAYVLDPTFTTIDVRAEEKGKYRSRLAFQETHVIAGVPAQRPPRRSWAVQPLRRLSNQLLDPEGRLGIVPLHPVKRDWTALEAWLLDLLRRIPTSVASENSTDGAELGPESAPMASGEPLPPGEPGEEPPEAATETP